ncbi:phosphoribosylamine--glycine ligase [Helicobacter sp. 11S02596-1]|uniref:phosphoribosylamine--glycine ligase n=1 Tax=Helicobacter sp. 11S02596-1 TaxID=1476194 RepID=UPI000BA55F5F|nr:phosphoribosylamine--glycine ligase [Helicobacter sp. 11S02596-1]PAF41412.1 phosphoribosylamine--glycine ligase [Helicobacter sp. 11S02596-1]
MKQKILIIGSGGREYALGKKFLEDSRIEKIYFCPGNGATEEIGENITCKDFEAIVRFSQECGIDLVVIGPEVPLVEGLADELQKAGINVFGPSKQAAQLEGSKAFMKDFVSRHNIPTARYLQTSDLKLAKSFLASLTLPVVIKADGLCAGKGVIIATTQKEALETLESMLDGKSFGNAGKRVVIEEFLDGYELSVFALADGEDYVLLPVCQDHKRLLNGDEGPNTGGMGAYAPTPLCDESLKQKIKTKIIEPTLKGMSQEGMPFSGVLFAGVMVIVIDGELEPYLLEFNVRFGDPECEVLLPLLKTPLLDLCRAVSDHRLGDFEVAFFDGYCLGVVAVSKDYPYQNASPETIFIKDCINEFDPSSGHLIFAGVSKKDGKLVSSGGRVLLSVGRGKTLLEAKKQAYSLMNKVHFEGMAYRNDIGFRALESL